MIVFTSGLKNHLAILGIEVLEMGFDYTTEDFVVIRIFIAPFTQSL